MKSGMLTVALLLLLVPAALQAQSPSASGLRDRLMPSGAALTLTAPVAVNHADSKTPTPAPMSQGAGASVAYMIVGAALFAGGLIAGGGAGTVLILAGAGIGAYGLYLYFQ